MDYLKENFILVQDRNGDPIFIRADSIKEIRKKPNGTTGVFVMHKGACQYRTLFHSKFEDVIAQLREIKIMPEVYNE